MTDYDVEKKAEELLQAIGKELAKSEQNMQMIF